MKLSPDFTLHLAEAHEYYNSPKLDLEAVWKPGLHYVNKMFLLEGKDFDKAVSVYSDKRFADLRRVDNLQKWRESYLKANWSTQKEKDCLYWEVHTRFAATDEFVEEIRKECSYKKKESGRKLLDEILDELWYSQDDFKLIRDAASKFYFLCEFWFERNKVSQQENHMSNTYQELLSLGQEGNNN